MTSARSSTPASTAWAMSPPWLACSHSSEKTRTRASSSTAISCLPGPSAPISDACWPGASDPFGQKHLATRRDGDDDVGARARLRVTPPRPRRARRRRRALAPTSTSHSATSRPRARNVLRGRPAVHAGADHGGTARIGPTERLGRKHRRRAGPKRRHRARVEHGTQHAVRGVGDEDEPHHRREPRGRVPRKRRHPLQERVPATERRHGTEVAGRIGVHVHLRRHRPLAACVRDERVANRLERALRRDGLLDGGAVEERDVGNAQTALTATTSRSSAVFASSKSIVVFGS